MPGQTNLETVLNSLKISCDDVEYGFATSDSSKSLSIDDKVLGFFREAEGLTIFAATEYFEACKQSYEGPFAKLTIEINTSLELVGLTAALAKKLTKVGISANVVAAFYHDHIFVPYAQAQEATDALMQLKAK